MTGFIYIAGSFETVNRSKCGRGKDWIDNDPHFWTSPPTWGICRNDLRREAKPGDYVFFVLPKRARHPQMLLGYMQISEKITHVEAFRREDSPSKRMGSQNPNGNMMVDDLGNYNQFDGGAHKSIFHEIKGEYVVSDVQRSKFLTDSEIRRLAPSFVGTLHDVFGGSGENAIDYIHRIAANNFSERQIQCLLKMGRYLTKKSRNHQGILKDMGR